MSLVSTAYGPVGTDGRTRGGPLRVNAGTEPAAHCPQPTARSPAQSGPGCRRGFPAAVGGAAPIASRSPPPHLSRLSLWDGAKLDRALKRSSSPHGASQTRASRRKKPNHHHIIIKKKKKKIVTISSVYKRESLRARCHGGSEMYLEKCPETGAELSSLGPCLGAPEGQRPR